MESIVFTAVVTVLVVALMATSSGSRVYRVMLGVIAWGGLVVGVPTLIEAATTTLGLPGSEVDATIVAGIFLTLFGGAATLVLAERRSQRRRGA